MPAFGFELIVCSSEKDESASHSLLRPDSSPSLPRRRSRRPVVSSSSSHRWQDIYRDATCTIRHRRVDLLRMWTLRRLGFEDCGQGTGSSFSKRSRSRVAARFDQIHRPFPVIVRRLSAHSRAYSWVDIRVSAFLRSTPWLRHCSEAYLRPLVLHHTHHTLMSP